MRKIGQCFLVFLLVFSLFPQGLTAQHIEEIVVDEGEHYVILFADDIDGEIELYESAADIEDENYIVRIPDETTVQLLKNPNKTNEDTPAYIFVRYIDEHSGDVYDGYVHEDYVVQEADAEAFRENRNLTNLAEEETLEVEKEAEDVEVPKEEEQVVQKSLTGLALKQPVNVYESTDRDANILRSYHYGHLLKYRTYSEDWYEATVFIDGERKTGYIHHDDVGDTARAVQGIALKKQTAVYEDTSKDANVLRNYGQGHILKYRAYDQNWFIATVFIQGKARTGFIHKNDVETAIDSPETLQGPSMKNPTKVYQSASTSASTLKEYTYGQILTFTQFTTNWYEATVFVKGKAETGYIYHEDIGSMDTVLSGYAQKNPTVVYSDMSRNAPKLKEYASHSKLIYKAYNKDWNEATVIIDGQAVGGYIHTDDVAATPPYYNGYAHKEPTTVYASTSKKSNKLKNYEKGSPLKYRYYNSTWFQATVIINGKRQIGYIHKNDVGLTVPTLTGYSLKSPTRVYAKTSRKSQTLKSYSKGTQLKFKRYNQNWYEATVFLNGKKQTGYIHTSDIGKATDISFVNPLKTYTYTNMISDIKKLKKAYPDLVDYRVVGKSEYGRDIYAVTLGKGKASLFINGSIHAREWISTNLNMYMLENYAKAYTTNKRIQGYDARKILNDTTITFMPMVNPDGVTLQQSGLGAFPKKDHASLIRMNGGSRNFKRWKANGKGVDINRNFSVHWNKQNGPNKPHHQNYRGSKALSSKEAQTMVKLVKDIKPEMSVNYHSSGRVLYWGYIQKGARYTRDLKHAKAVNRMTGYSLIYPGNNPSGGGFLQWFTETTKGPSLTPELSPYVGNTNPSPMKQFNRIWRENQAVGLYGAQESAKLYKK